MQANRTKDLAVSLLSFAVSSLIFLLCLSLFIFTARLITPKKTETTPIEYTVRLSAVSKKTALGIKVGDPAVDAVKKGRIGSLSAVAVTPHRYELAENGKLLLCESNDVCDVTLTLRATASQDGRTVSGMPLYIGTSVSLRLPAYTGTGICISLKEVSS